MDPSQLQPGYWLDRYELLCPLAYGGMASVWLARFGGRLGFERLVVVKMILPQYSQDPRFQQMFLDEARIASRIEHSNVARILDLGEHEGNYFIVMEWVDGDSLSKLIRAVEQRNARVPAGIALRICADAASGLHAAHALKDRDGHGLHVVHRDVSPQNLLIANTGATMLIDFGVAKARDRVSQETSAGQLKGKIRYMAPEQARGLPIDHRADIWALGAILYELFAGNPPYDGSNEVATLHKLTSGTPPPPLADDVPEAAQAIVRRALAFDPAERYGTALELNLALETAMAEIGEPTSIAVVAHYTGELLADRKHARKKAVDAALARPNAGHTGAPATGSPLAIAGTPQAFRIPSAGTQTPALPFAPVRVPPAPHSSHRDVAPPFPRPIGPDVMNLAESPSAASSATLGSAALEYSRGLEDQTAHRRRVAGVAVGVSVAASIVAVVLIVGTAMKRRDAARSATPPPPPVVAATATATREEPAAATATGTPAAEPTTSEPAASVVTASRKTVTTHVKPPPPPTTVAKPAGPRPPAPTASTPVVKKDYGF